MPVFLPPPAILQASLSALLPDARLQAQALPQQPGIRLWLLDPALRACRLSAAQSAALMAAESYWFLCWASGQAAAGWLLDGTIPVYGRRLLDLGAGSGVVAVAAALAGASAVAACDSDAGARLAVAANARLNGVDIALIDSTAITAFAPDLIVLADVLYDRSNLPLLGQLADTGADIWVAESRLQSLPDPGYRHCATVCSATVPELGGFDEFGSARLFCRPAV